MARKTDTLTPLGHHEAREWISDPSLPGGRKNRRGGPYEAFVPDPLAAHSFALDDEAVAEVTEAAKALAELQRSKPRLASLNALASTLLRSESAASSRIEGLKVSQRRLARAAYQRERGRDADRRAAEVLGNVEAMKLAIELGSAKRAFRVAEIKRIHKTLLRFTADEAIAGVVREEQNWIGGNDYNPIGAAYVPPPHEYVPDLLNDLCTLIRREDLAPIAQAAIVHAQFENIHPFVDGNGRVGRALIHTVLRRRGETNEYVPPISLVLGAQQRNYFAGFGEFSGGDVSSWCITFAGAARLAAKEAERMAQAIEERQAAWLERLGKPRRDAAVRQLVSDLPAQPVIDVAAGRRLTGKSHVAVQNALQQLEDASILSRLNERKWGRVWECDELLDLVEEFEGTVASPREPISPNAVDR